MPSRVVRSPLRQVIINQDRQMRDELEREMSETAQEAKTFLVKATQRWRRKPRFRVKLKVSRGLLRWTVLAIGPNRKVFQFVDKGTGKFGPKKRAYKIPKVPTTKVLCFQTGYSAKTRPIAKFNVGTGRSTGPVVFAKQVIHPGIKARKFTETITKELQADLARRINNAMQRGIRRAR